MHEEVCYDLASWSVALQDKAAVERDFVADEMARYDVEIKEVLCPYREGDSVMVRRPTHQQKCLAPFEPALSWVGKSAMCHQRRWSS